MPLMPRGDYRSSVAERWRRRTIRLQIGWEMNRIL
jgi:hypothetical protein